MDLDSLIYNSREGSPYPLKSRSPYPLESSELLLGPPFFCGKEVRYSKRREAILQQNYCVIAFTNVVVYAII